MVPTISDFENDSTAGSLPTHTIYDLLSHRRRRAMLRRLDEHESPVSLSDLSRWVALGEADSDGDGVRSERLRNVRISLYHVHVPKLSNAGVVAFDRAERTVELLDDGRALLHRLEALDPSSEPNEHGPST
ncbi:DUF7344 domain-containing protein [Halalkalicoccus salilacus]|uniref:DUF7344 domain-containing protein n=1 Tax=Halalkalicoccus TaxID=332246 RepID=UPI002F96A703